MKVQPARLLLYGVLLCGASSLATYAVLRAARPAPPVVNDQPPPPPPDGALDYTPPAGHGRELIAFEKASLFLWNNQESDGHWSAEKTGAAPEFRGHNADVALTALSTYALMCSSRGKVSEKRPLAGARKGLDWLLKHTGDDGRIVDETGGGEPVVAQLLAAMTLMQSSSMSTRPQVKQKAAAAVRYAVLKMMSPAGGFGATPKATFPRADVTALGVFIYRSAQMEEIKFSDAAVKAEAAFRAGSSSVQPKKKEDPDFRPTDPDPPSDPLPQNVAQVEKDKQKSIDDELKKGIAALEVPGQPGAYSLNGPEKAASWEGTVGMMLAQVLYLVPGREMSTTLKYVFGEYNEKETRFDKLAAQFPPDKHDYRAWSIWQFTHGCVYLYGENVVEWKEWMKTIDPLVFGAQQPDGGWPVAGADAAHGRVWRAALHALTLYLITPTPPPPQPPSEPEK